MWYYGWQEAMVKTLRKFISLFVAATFAIVVFFCLNTGLNHTNNSASCCEPASSRLSGHQTDIGEHLQHWQQLFNAIHPTSNDLAVLLNILFVGLAFGTFLLRLKNCETNFNLISAKIEERNAIAKLFNPILQALSKGILNSRLYNLSLVSR